MPNDTAFSNKDIVAPRKNKPHIVLIRGYWRVSPAPRPPSTETPLWVKAHSWVEKRNEAIRVVRRMVYWPPGVNTKPGLSIDEVNKALNAAGIRTLKATS